LPYARQIGAPFIFLTNGEPIYFWDYQNDDARIVQSFFSRRDLERLFHMRGAHQPLATMPIPDCSFRQGETWSLRPYQTEAMQALDHTVELGKRRFLIELPTGYGKTDLIVLYPKRLIEGTPLSHVGPRKRRAHPEAWAYRRPAWPRPDRRGAAQPLSDRGARPSR
jgi:type I restriction enzyme R subunit